MVLQRKRGRRRGRRAFCLLSDSYIQSGINSEAMRLQSAYAACCSAAFSWKYKLFFVGGLSISLPLPLPAYLSSALPPHMLNCRNHPPKNLWCRPWCIPCFKKSCSHRNSILSVSLSSFILSFSPIWHFKIHLPPPLLQRHLFMVWKIFLCNYSWKNIPKEKKPKK